MKRSVALRVSVVLILLWLAAGSSIGLAQEPGVAGAPSDNPPLATASISPIVNLSWLFTAL